MTVAMANVGDGHERVLVLAPIGRDGPMAAALLRDAGLTAEVCADLTELRDHLDAGAGAAVIAEEALYREPLEILVDWVARQPPWSDFPFIILTSGDRGTSPDHLRRLRLLEALRNVSLLERPAQAVTLVSAVHAALRARRRQYETRGHLLEREQAASRLEALVADRTGELQEANRRLRAEIAEREQTEAALRQAQKMEAIGQLTGGVAHDFNNLLAAMLGNLELAIEQVTSERLRRLLSNAERAGRRAAQLTEQLLAFSRKQHLNLGATDLNALVSSMGDLLFRTMGGMVRIETVLEKDLWPALADASQVEVMILNLAINGRDAMPAGGRLTIRTANIGPATARRPAELTLRDYVAVSVSDTGSGMTEEVLAKAFEPFFTTKDVGQGTGLGLSQVYGVARQSGGTVRIDTRLGRGTTVTAYLPRATGATANPLEPAAVPRGHRRGAILIVDDNPDVRELTVAFLESLGYTATAAESGRAAVEILERGASIDLMLIDYAMPDLTGAETVRLVRAKRPDLRILMMTGYAETAALEGEAGREGVLKKPFTRAELAAKIDSAFRRAGPVGTTTSSKVVPIRPLTSGG
jgi:signal transduction histidine kinase/CheY-like chemotaxis protein